MPRLERAKALSIGLGPSCLCNTGIQFSRFGIRHLSFNLFTERHPDSKLLLGS